jgi:hypothetical protein
MTSMILCKFYSIFYEANFRFFVGFIQFCLVLGGAVPDMSSIFLLGVAVRSSFSLQVFSAPHPICLSFGFAALVFILSLTIFLRSSHPISPFRSARAPSRDSATTVPTRPVPARLSLDFSSAICSLVGPFVRSLSAGWPWESICSWRLHCAAGFAPHGAAFLGFSHRR